MNYFIQLSLLSLISVWLILEGAGNEPYTSFNAYDAYTQLGLGTAIWILWGIFSLQLLIKLMTKELTKVWLLGLT
jgi:hypothetical protein